MELSITAKMKLHLTKEQKSLCLETSKDYLNACNYLSELVYSNKKTIGYLSLHKLAYQTLRTVYGLKSQMAQSSIKTVLASYRTLIANGHDWTLVQYKNKFYDVVFGRDFSFIHNLISINTRKKRIKVLFETKGMKKFFDETWKFGTSKIIKKNDEFFIHMSATKEFDKLKEVKHVVGADLGLNFLATVYDEKGKTAFVNGRSIKSKRDHYKRMRKSLQKKGTPSARKKLKKIGQREKRWMADVNHRITKALVDRYGKGTVFVLEDLKGIRDTSEHLTKNNRWMVNNWGFFQFRTMLEYKAKMNQSKVVFIDPEYTSQSCPKCGHTEKMNRNKKMHSFECKQCHYHSNDDRIGSMNIYQKGLVELMNQSLKSIEEKEKINKKLKSLGA